MYHLSDMYHFSGIRCFNEILMFFFEILMRFFFSICCHASPFQFELLACLFTWTSDPVCLLMFIDVHWCIFNYVVPSQKWYSVATFWLQTNVQIQTRDNHLNRFPRNNLRGSVCEDVPHKTLILEICFNKRAGSAFMCSEVLVDSHKSIRHRETQRDTEGDRERQRETERDRVKQRDGERERETENGRERQRERQKKRERERESQRERERERERQTNHKAPAMKSLRFCNRKAFGYIVPPWALKLGY